MTLREQYIKLSNLCKLKANNGNQVQFPSTSHYLAAAFKVVLQVFCSMLLISAVGLEKKFLNSLIFYRLYSYGLQAG